ncbi:MAG TPA: 50S ribosomal protein L25 [Verrucomicrobiae bacterium]
MNAFPRELSKRLGVKKVRTNGRIPAVIYGRHNKPQNIEVASKELEQVIHTAHSEILLVNLAVDKNSRLALVREIQHHPLSGKMLHVDFQEVAENEKVTAMVPVETLGEAEGVKSGGGVLEHVLFKVKVRATPKDLPDVINIDVTKMQIGQSIHIGDIQTAAGVEIIGRKETPVVAVAAPLTEAQEAAATDAAGAPAQPEMLKEKKEEGAAAKPAAGGDKAAAGGAAKAADKGAADKKPAEKKK